MKSLLLFLILALPIQWETDFAVAKKNAKEQHKLILLNFSGSDWCGPCILLRKDYLEDAGFADMAKDNLILVNADFPRKKKNALPEETVKRNEALAETYNKTGSFPFTLLLDADGKVLKTWSGKPDFAVTEWTQQVKTICDAHK